MHLDLGRPVLQGLGLQVGPPPAVLLLQQLRGDLPEQPNEAPRGRADLLLAVFLVGSQVLQSREPLLSRRRSMAYAVYNIYEEVQVQCALCATESRLLKCCSIQGFGSLLRPRLPDTVTSQRAARSLAANWLAEDAVCCWASSPESKTPEFTCSISGVMTSGMRTHSSRTVLRPVVISSGRARSWMNWLHRWRSTGCSQSGGTMSWQA